MLASSSILILSFRSHSCPYRKSLLFAAGILVAGGTTAYLQSCSRVKKSDSFGNYNGLNDVKENSDKLLTKVNNAKTTTKQGGFKSLKVLAAVLLSEMGKVGTADLLAMIAIAVLRTSLSNRLAKVQGFLFRAAFLRRVPLFLRLISENILLCFLLSTMHSTSKYVTGTLSLCFRKILTKLIHTHYFENMAYYKLSHVDGRITNPEQRIASDVPKFCSELSELVQDDLTAVTDVVLYTWRLVSYASPKYLVYILGYVLGAGALIKKFSPSFGKLMAKEQQLGGEYRQLHSRLRTHAESIAFYGGERREEFHIQEKFRTLVKHMKVVHHEHWWFGMIQDFLAKYLGATVAVILIIEPFFAGGLKPDTSTLGRATMLSNLRYHTSVIISLFQSLGTLSISSRKLSRLSGYAERIHELIAISRELSSGDKSLQRVGSRNYFSDADYVEFSGVKVVTPTGNVLVQDLSLKVEPGSNLLITGPNGSGKSSLFRVLGGLWPLVSGHIVKPGVGSELNKEIFYVPQRPYTAVGTLRDQLIYPLTSDQEVEALTRSGMVELLKNVDLEYLLDRYPPEKEVNWGEELSLGEQQRLGMARLFYHKPKFAILDECTSAVTTDMEERFCAKVRAMGTSCITISHRPALVAFHDVVLSLDGEGGWEVDKKRKDSRALTQTGTNAVNSETNRKSDALVVQRAFAATDEDSTFPSSKAQSYISEVIARSPQFDHNVPVPSVLQLKRNPRALPLRVAAMFKILVPTVLDKQGAQLLAVALLVISRTFVSDRIASLNGTGISLKKYLHVIVLCVPSLLLSAIAGTTVKYVLEQDKAAFVRLVGVSVLQSAASSFIAPSLRHLTARLALEWRIRLTRHLLKNYLRNNAFYKVFNLSSKNVDADQRITHDLEKLTTDLSGLVTGMVKPSVDILWFTWRMKLLTGRRGVTILYAYMLLGLGFLRTVTPDFGDLASQEQQLEGTFRFMHERLRTHAESVAFFGGGAREKAMIESRFKELLRHSTFLLKKKWLYGILDDFVTKQLPHNVTWGLSLLYAVEHKGDRAMISTQGELAHALRYLASVVSQSFFAFGDILELHKKFVELSALFNDQGPNGSGKSSIFRVLRGLWPIANGGLAKPLQQFSEEKGYGCGIFYVPQRPYTCLGTLRDQIIYPLSREEATIRTLRLFGKGKFSSTYVCIF
ncbi:unnamed protein product [Linum tenue]|uniref:ABC transporter D family member 1 n=1 Tax=Linum tenue TaxID=586396 RepID=A0AAV0KE30_9ROSI|nr:unnamed protein product [Linum tenue]